MKSVGLGLLLLVIGGASPARADVALVGPVAQQETGACPSREHFPCAICREAFSQAATTTCGLAVDIDYGSFDPDGDPIRCTQVPGRTALLPFGLTDVTLTCEDPQGNFEVCATYVTVTDETVPVITLVGPQSMTAECGAAYNDPGFTASDPCERDLSHAVVKNDRVIPNVPGNYTITYDVRNQKGRSARQQIRTVTVQDTVAPRITCPAHVEVQAGSDGLAPVGTQGVQVTDTCSRDLVPTPSNTSLPAGTHVVTYTARDAAGNEASCTVPFTVRSANGLPSGNPSLPDRAMLGGGCSTAADGNAPGPAALMGLAALWIRLASKRSRQFQRDRAWSRPALACWLVLVALGMSVPASAQPADIPAFELERLRLNPSGMGSWVLGTGELLPARGYRLSLASHYEHRPLELYENGTLLGVIVRHRATAVLSAAVGLWSRVELGAQVPFLLLQQGDDLAHQGVRTPQNGLALATPQLTARLGLLAEHQEDPLDLAVGVHAGPGVGSASALARELNATPSLMMGRRFGPLKASLEAGLLLRPRTLLNDDGNIQDELGHALRLGTGLASTAEGFGGEVAAVGSVPLQREGYSLELLGGLRLPLSELLEAHALTGLGIGTAPGTPRFRLLLGMSFGRTSQLPVSKEPSEPQALGEEDTDGDGVLNRTDACPEEPGPRSNQGCPIKDSDGDGIVDGTDRCPDQAGIAEMRGCPPEDTDGDEVPDHRDNCRKIPGPPSNQGCPTELRQLVVIQRNRIQIKDTIYFDYNKDTIKAESFPLLDQVAHVLIEHPEIVSVSIEGHTDSDGSNEYNRDLSLRRAGAVRDYLHRRGVARARMSIQGFGEDRPLQPNDTEVGRAINRRVEFITRYESDKP